MKDTSEHTQEVSRQFSKQAHAYADTDQARDMKGMARLVGLTAADADSRVLDVACGPGRLTRAFAAVSAGAVGCDATAALLDIAREEARDNGLANVEFVVGDATALDFADGSFDVVACRAAFHHFENPEQVLGEMCRVTRPGGQLLIADILGSADAAVGARHDALERLCDPTHTRCLSAEAFEGMFSRAGLAVSRVINAEMDYELESWIAHGGPAPEAAEKIRETCRANVAQDSTGLKMRVENGSILFTHKTAVYLLAR